MIYLPGGVLGAVLPHLENIKYLDLSLCHHIYFPTTGLEDNEDSVIEEHLSKQWLIDGLPPNLETFCFRGPTAVVTGN